MNIAVAEKKEVSGAKIGTLIRLRRAKKRLEKMEKEAAADVRAEMETAGVTEASAPAGDVTLHTSVALTLSAKKLVDDLGIEEAVKLLKVSNEKLKKAKGEKYMKDQATKRVKSVKLLTKPAKIEAKIQVKVGGSD